MHLVFDLDDTLYPERSYVESGLRAVADHLQQRMRWDAEASYVSMVRTMEREGRGAIFDRLLEEHQCCTRSLVKQCVDVYRHHHPSLRLYPEAAALLPQLCGPLYLVTDGHKLVQQRKVDALAIAPWFRRMYLTHRFGIHRAKPSTYCFEHIRKQAGCEWREILYVGDNPAKDFVNLNRAGAHTVRVLTGNHRKVRAQAGYDAQHTISNLADLPTVLAGITQ